MKFIGLRAFLLSGLMTMMLGFGFPAAAQWVRTLGPFGARITSLDGLGPYRFVGSTKLSRSSDDGLSWLTVDSANGGVSSIAISGSSICYLTWDNVLRRSSDSGKTWEEADAGFDQTNMYCLSTNGTNFYVGTDEGVYLSTDGARTWRLITNGFDPNGRFEVYNIFGTGKYVYAWSVQYIYRCDSAGTLWTLINIPDTISMLASVVLNGNIFFATSSEGVVRMAPNGRSFIPVNTGLPSNITSLTSNGSELIAGSSNGIFISTDLGTTWNSEDNGLQDSNVTSVFVAGDTVLTGTGMGIFRSVDNGKTWSAASVGLDDASAYALLTDGSELWAGTSLGVFASTDQGATWKTIDQGMAVESPVRAFARSNKSMYAGSDAGIYRLEMDSTNWTNLSATLPYASVNAIGTIGNAVFIEDWQGGCDPRNAVCSFDSNMSWVIDSSMIIDQVGCFGTVGSILFAGGSGYTDQYDHSAAIAKSKDYGTTWIEADTELYEWSVPYTQYAYNYVTALTSLGTDLIASGNNGIFVSSDTGQSWIEVHQWNPGISETEFGFDCLITAGTILIGGTNGGVYASKDTGATWVRIDKGLTDTTVNALAIDDTILYAATNSGVWRRGFSEISNAVQKGSDVIEAAGIQNIPSQEQFDMFPNPTPGPVTIVGAITRATVTNLLGETILQITNPNASATLDLTNQPSGTYFVRVETAAGTTMQKIVKE